MGPSVVRPSLEPHTDSMTDTMILDTIGAFLARDVAPHVHGLEHDDIYPETIVGRMRELGLFGATIATEYGGLGLPCATYAEIVERIARVWMSLTGIFNSHLIMSGIVQRNGTKTWISNGIHGSCFALLVKTDTTVEPRHRGMSMLLAEKGPGFTVSRKLEKLGYK